MPDEPVMTIDEFAAIVRHAHKSVTRYGPVAILHDLPLEEGTRTGYRHFKLTSFSLDLVTALVVWSGIATVHKIWLSPPDFTDNLCGVYDPLLCPDKVGTASATWAFTYGTWGAEDPEPCASCSPETNCRGNEDWARRNGVGQWYDLGRQIAAEYEA